MQPTGLSLTSFFDLVAGLPMHPLVVHIAVVLLPLATLSLIAIIAVPRWRAAYGWLTMAGLAAGTAGAVLAAQTGEALALRVGQPADHAKWGDLLEKASVALFVAAVLWFVLQRRAAARTGRAAGSTAATLSRTVAAGLSILLSVVILTLSVVVGHSGAAAVWEGRVAAPATSVEAPPPRPSAPRTPSPSSPAASASPSPSAAAGAITMADVQLHATATDCWTVVDRGVYDLTAWIPQHPGGPTVIRAMCGRDGSAAFRNEHNTKGEPNDVLGGFRIGTVTP